MTGYTAVSAPSVMVPPPGNPHWEYDCEIIGGCATYTCGGPGGNEWTKGSGGFRAGIGVCLDCKRVHFNNNFTIAVHAIDYLESYYDSYRAYYDAAAANPAYQQDVPVNGSLLDCPPLDHTSTFNRGNHDNPDVFDLTAPLLNIQPWGVNAETGLPKIWVCGELEVPIEWFSSNATAFCQAGNVFQWGFSYLLLFSVCIAQFLFAMMMYALWQEPHRYRTTSYRRIKKSYRSGHQEWRDGDYPSILSHAANMVRQAEAAHGQDITLWCAQKLDDVVWRGKKGMRAVELPHDGYEIVQP